MRAEKTNSMHDEYQTSIAFNQPHSVVLIVAAQIPTSAGNVALPQGGK